MKKRDFIFFLLFLSILFCHLFLSGKVSNISREKNIGYKTSTYVIPSNVLKIISFGYEEILSDFLFLNVHSFYGSTLERRSRPRLNDDEWFWIYEMLDRVTYLDPYLKDTYMFTNGNLLWDGKQYESAVKIFERGIKARSDDWEVPFYAGFASFYFLNDNERAVEYLMESSKRPGSSDMIPLLISRFARGANNAESAIFYLKELIKNSKNHDLLVLFEYRLEVLENITFLQQIVDKYELDEKKDAESFTQLYKKGYVKSLPQDRYGNKYFIDNDGNVKIEEK